jgi:chitinase
MTEHVDWIQLISDDLHGTWDRDNLIGGQVLARTSITEMGLALDLVC